MILQEIDPNNIFCLIMKHHELEDLTKVVKWFSETKAELHPQKKWKLLLDDLYQVRKQENVKWQS
jgi:flavorubredoxin